MQVTKKEKLLELCTKTCYNKCIKHTIKHRAENALIGYDCAIARRQSGQSALKSKKRAVLLRIRFY